MANLFANLPVPAGNGSGAWVDVSLYGKQKTITIDGTFTGSIIIEVSLDGGTTSAELLTLQAATEVVVDVACDRMRVTRKGIDPQLPGSANVDVGAPALTDPVLVSAIACPAGNGVGATLDITDFPTFKTVSVAGTRLSGSLFIEISDDGTNWDELFTFTGSGQKSASVTASDVRVRRAGADSQVPGTAVVNIAAVPDADGGGGGGGGGGNVFTFQPGGGGTGPFVFEDWDALVEALNSARDDAGDTQPTGLYYILFDDSVTTPCVIPAGAADDMKGVTWTAGSDVEADVQISNGKTFTNLRSFSGQLFVELVAGAAAAPVSDFADGDIVLIEGGAWIYSSATPPFFNVTGTPSISFRVFNSTLGDGVRDAVAQTAGSSLIIEAYASAEISVAAISGAAASSLAVLLLSSSAYIRNQAAYAGSISIQPRAVPRWSPITTTSPQAGDTVILANPPSTVTLPTLISPFTNGQTVIVKVGAADDGLVTINAAGGQTIDGASSMTFANTSGYGGVILIGNGIAW